ncbi:MAG: ATP-dependent 6-phosphofructokinase [Planctomycetota bacterium]|jgi:6-phosphofructokinase 1
MKRIAVLTSGGDSPGMNAAIRAVVRGGLEIGIETLGVEHGYKGLVAGDMRPLGPRDVGGIMQLGGTMLGSARLPEFAEKDVRAKAIANMTARGVEALVVIGGNGSQTGASALFKDGFPVVGVASTIDNDLMGSDPTIGVDTALDVALESIDRLKTTASSHHRAFLVETMGRNCGYLALVAGIAGGAEAVVVPEFETSPEAVADELQSAYSRGKSHAIVVVAEGATYNAEKMAAWFREHEEDVGFALRVTKLGYVQRGGAPGAFDRFLATRLGAGAVELVAKGSFGRLVGLIKDEVTSTPYSEIVGRTKSVDPKLVELARVMAE